MEFYRYSLCEPFESYRWNIKPQRLIEHNLVKITYLDWRMETMNWLNSPWWQMYECRKERERKKLGTSIWASCGRSRVFIWLAGLARWLVCIPTALSSAEAPLRNVSAGVKFRGRRRREPLPEATPNMAAIRGSHFVTRVVCVLMPWKWRVFVKLSCCAMWRIFSRKLTYMLRNRGKFVALIMTV